VTDDAGTDFASLSLRAFAAAVAEPVPVPAGGSVAAGAAAFAAALVAMGAELSRRRAAEPALARRWEEVRAHAGRLQDRLFELAAEDARAVQAALAARKLPAATDAERSVRTREAADRWGRAAAVQVDIIRAALAVATHARELAEQGFRPAAGDANMAALLVAAVAAGCRDNVRLDVIPFGLDPELVLLKQEAERLAAHVAREAARARAALERGITPSESAARPS
jgi:formiminotetrahydrofolate cyclodeaminase